MGDKQNKFARGRAIVVARRRSPRRRSPVTQTTITRFCKGALKAGVEVRFEFDGEMLIVHEVLANSVDTTDNPKDKPERDMGL